MRSNYMRRLYVQYHFPVSNYPSNYQSRKAVEDTNKLYCACSREIGNYEVICSVCRESSPIMEGAAETDILESFLEMLKPINCSNCSERFSDLSSMTSMFSYPKPILGLLHQMFSCLRE